MKDRGIIKWAAFMMPEHNTLLQNWKLEDLYETQPALSEDQMEEIERCMHECLSNHTPIRIRYFNKQAKQHQQIVGTITKYDPLNHTITVLEQHKHSSKTIVIHSIVDAKDSEVETNEAD